MKFAVIGAGITGLGAAWLLSQKHDVTLYESASRLGGHANTLTVNAPDGPCPIDTGFIVYNTASYPNLIALFDRLGVPTAETSMGFAVSLDNGAYEYSGSGLGGLFGQTSNLLSPAHWRMTAEIFRFFRQAAQLDAKSLPLDVTLGDWLAQNGYSKRFIDAHIVPMGAAIWSTPAEDMLGFPFAAFARFFENHGLLQAFNRPAWRTVAGGSQEYVTRIASAIPGSIRLSDAVAAVSEIAAAQGKAKQVSVTSRSGASATFDGVLMACHADEARRIVAAADPAAHEVLSAFRYAANEAVLHTDARLMPRRRRLWQSWNYLGQSDARSPARAPDVRNEHLIVSYWMNKLQPLTTNTDYFVTLNPGADLEPAGTVARISYTHPMFDEPAMRAQLKLWSLQGRTSIWYAGSYLGYGFHEDGLQSGLAAAEDMSLRIGGEGGRVLRPWSWDARQSRIFTGGDTPHDARPGELGWSANARERVTA